VLNFLKTKFNQSGKNFFYIHYLDPHDAYRPPVDYGFFSGKTPTRPLNVVSLSGESAVVKKFFLLGKITKKGDFYSGTIDFQENNFTTHIQIKVVQG